MLSAVQVQGGFAGLLFLYMEIKKIIEAEVDFRLKVFDLLVKNFNDEDPSFAKNLIAKMREVHEALSQDEGFAAQQSKLQELIERLKWVDSVDCEPADEISFRLKVYRLVTNHLKINFDDAMARNLMKKVREFTESEIIKRVTAEQIKELEEILNSLDEIGKLYYS